MTSDLQQDEFHDAFKRQFQTALDRAPGLISWPTHAIVTRGVARRRRAYAGLGVSLAVLGIVVTASLASLLGSQSRAPQTAAEPPPDPTGWTRITDSGVSFAVPSDWKPGALSQWCAGGDWSMPVVQLPGTIHSFVACAKPIYAYGAWLSPSVRDGDWAPGSVPSQFHADSSGKALFPEESWVAEGRLSKSDPSLLVVAPTQHEAQEVLDSLRSAEAQ